MNTGASVWDDHPELVEQLKKLNLTGDHSLADIAKILGHGLTRNAICGKLHRLNVPVVSRASTKGRVKFTRPKVKTMAPAEPEPPEPPEPEATPIKNGELEYHHCKFPIGDPAEPDFRFCGGKRRVPQPYCRKHLDVAFSRQTAPRARSW